MKRIGAKFITILAIALLAVVATLFVCLYHSAMTAYADEIPAFVIRTTTGQDWELELVGDGVVASATGDFFDYMDRSNPSQPALLFRDAIKAELTSRSLGDDEYNLSFEMPTPTIAFSGGIDSNPYTEFDDSEIIITISVATVFSDAEITIEYKPQGGADSEYVVFPTAGGNTVRFGKSVDKGVYDVRARVRETVDYLGRRYVTDETSSALVCHITDSDLPDRLVRIPSLEPFEYGATLQDIADRATVFDRNGKWTVASSLDPNTMLPASESAQEIVLDYESDNKNYNKRMGVNVSVTVSKRRLIVYVDSVDRLKGKPLVTEFTYHCDTPLAAGDTFESIGFSVAAEGVDPNVPGTYPIYAHATSNNYAVETRTIETQHVMHGFYRVHATSVSVHADDFREIVITRAEGFIGWDVDIERAFDVECDLDGYVVSVAYKFVVKDSDGNEVSDVGEVTITLEPRRGDVAIAYVADGEWIVVDLDESGVFNLPSGVKAFVVLQNAPVQNQKIVEWNDALTAITSLIIVFAAAIWIVIVCYVAKRRLLK